MAIFSNLDGTMKNNFTLGKNGAVLSSTETDIKITNYKGTSLLPIESADPVKEQHLVTLNYFNTHKTENMVGTSIPESTLGVNGNIYFQVDDTKIISIFLKDNNIWKPFNPTV